MEKGSFSFFENLKLNRIYEELSRPILIADGLKSPENMGSILRLAGNIGAQHTIFISDIAHEFRKYKIRRTACGALENSSWQIITDVGQIAQLIPPDYDCVALETTGDAVDIFSFQFPEKVAFVVGSEGYGISDQLLDMVHHKLYIPLPGNISSLNVTHALSIALFEWLRQMR